MADEDDLTPKCPYCSSTDNCAHLLAAFDLTFVSIEGGYLFEAKDRIWETIEAGLQQLLLTRRTIPKTGDYSLDELIKDVQRYTKLSFLDEDGAEEDDFSPEDIEIETESSTSFFNLLVEHFRYRGVESEVEWDGPMHYSSGMSIVWHDDPEKLVNEYIEYLSSKISELERMIKQGSE